MKPIDMLFLSQEEVASVGLTMGEIIQIVEDTFFEHGLGRYENPPKPGIHTRSDAFLHAMPAYLDRKRIAGMKWVSGYSANPGRGLPSIMGLIVLNDVDTGQPMAMMEGGLITALRTAGVSGVSAKYLALPNAARIGIVGAGVQGRYHLLALHEVLPHIAEVRVFDTHPPTLDGYVAHFDAVMPFSVKMSDSIEETIRGADVVVTATGKLEDIIYRTEWIQEGALVLPVHMFGWGRSVITRADKFIVDDWTQFSGYINQHGKIYTPLPEPYAQMGQIVTGEKPGRTSPAERIVNFNLGIAIHDIAVADRVLAVAREKGLGTRVDLMKGALPFFI